MIQLSGEPVSVNRPPPNKRNIKKRRLSSGSQGNDEPGAGLGGGASGNEASDAEASAAGPLKKKGGAGRAAIPANFTNQGPAEYRYSSEIAQMVSRSTWNYLQ